MFRLAAISNNPRTDLVLPMFAGALIAVIIDVYPGYRFFDSPLFTASNPWPPKVATARVLEAGDEGGHKASCLGYRRRRDRHPLQADRGWHRHSIHRKHLRHKRSRSGTHTPGLFTADVRHRPRQDVHCPGFHDRRWYQAMQMLWAKQAATKGQSRMSWGSVDQRKEYGKHWVYFTAGAVVLAVLTGVWS